jgi:hypothetical protein
MSVWSRVKQKVESSNNIFNTIFHDVLISLDDDTEKEA